MKIDSYHHIDREEVTMNQVGISENNNLRKAVSK